MGRPIKFRAWNGRALEYGGFSVHATAGKLIPVFIVGYSYVKEDSPLMQFTGLLDKNGVEIYEGDIVRAYHGVYGEVINAEVKWHKGCFTLGRYWKDGIHDWYSMEQYRSEDMEVIGNIHESPELLNE